MKHKYYDVIVAWANGKDIECRTSYTYEWQPCMTDEEWIDELLEGVLGG